MSAPTRLLVLGLDAADPALLLQWAGEGGLPHLARLLARGRSGPSRSLTGFFVGSTWPSLYTGVNPARHGFHYLRQLDLGTYRFFRPADRGMVRWPPFWRALGDAGLRMAILDVPLAPLDPSIRGLQVVEWGGHDLAFGCRAAPAEAEALLARHGAYPFQGVCDRVERTATGYAAFVEALVRGVARKTELTADVLRAGGWDLVMQVFTESHCVGHQCWHLHDPSHPAHDPALAAGLGDPIRAVYRALDQAVGRLLDQVPEATVMLVVGHGMGPWHGAHFLLPEILTRLGVMTPLASPPEGPLRRALRAGWGRLPEPVRRLARSLRARRPRPGSTSPPGLGVDVTRSRCFPQPNGLAVSGVRLNLAGREPNGPVTPGAEAERLLSDLEGALAEIVDERTGRPAIRRVLRTASLYTGEHLAQLPDLLVEWSDEVATGSTLLAGGRGAAVRLRSRQIGVVEGRNDYGRTGEHRPDGLVVLAGPGIAPGRLAAPASVLDIAPTIGHLLGVTLTGLDGTPIDLERPAARPGADRR